jgi:hypothetical protein
MKIKQLKPRDLVAKDLRTPKYRMRKEELKTAYQRREKHQTRCCFVDTKLV